MNLNKIQINYLVDKLFRNLKEDANVLIKADESKIKSRIFDIILKNQEEEKNIDAEAKSLLKENEAIIKKDNLNYSKLFIATKKKIAKDKGFIL